MPDSSAAPDVVVFDIGEVLLDWNPRHLYRRIFADEATMEWFLAHVCTPAWNREQDRGRRWADAVDFLVRRWPEWRAEIEAFDARWEKTVAGEIKGSVALLRELVARDVPVYAITNFSDEKFPIAQQRYESLRLFRGVVVSGAEGLLKPDAAIFALFCERYGLAPQRCLFVDDMAANVEGARAAGMSAALFVDPPTLRRDLAAAGFLV